MALHNRKSGGVTLLVLVAVAVWAVNVGASTLTMPVTKYAVVASDSGYTRILIDLGELDKLAGKRILYAKCFLDIAISDCGDNPSALVNEVEVRPMADAWDALSASFDATLQTAPLAEKAPSGRHAVLQRGESGMTEILLTEFVQVWIDGKIDYHGLLLLLRVPGCDYELKENESLPAGAVGKLFVRYGDR